MDEVTQSAQSRVCCPWELLSKGALPAPLSETCLPAPAHASLGTGQVLGPDGKKCLMREAWHTSSGITFPSVPNGVLPPLPLHDRPHLLLARTVTANNLGPGRPRVPRPCPSALAHTLGWFGWEEGARGGCCEPGEGWRPSAGKAVLEGSELRGLESSLVALHASCGV